MSGVDSSFFHNRFARRIFLLFVLSTIIPLGVIAGLSFEHISAQLRQQSYEQSRQTSKAIGMDVFRRLSLMRAELDRIADLMRVVPLNDEAARRLDNVSFPDLSSLRIVNAAGVTTYPRDSTNDRSIVLTPEQKKQLALGKYILHIQHTSGDMPELLVLRPLDRDKPENGLLVATVSAQSLGSLESLLPGSTQLLILSPAAEPVYRSRELGEGIVDSLKPALAQSISGNVSWKDATATHLAGYWSIFTDVYFSMPYLVVVASQNEDEVLAPLRDFRNTYVPILVLALLAVSLIVASQVRRKLVPLVTLRDATGRIAQGDFTAQIRIGGNDEFAQLGDSFNRMAQKLEMQFASLATMAEIDRLILSSFDRRYIIKTVLGRIGELTPCSVAAVLELHDEHPGLARMSIRLCTPESGIVEHEMQVSDADVAALTACPDDLSIGCGETHPAYAAPLLQANDACRLLLLPSFLKQRLTGVLMLGYGADCEPGSENRIQLRKFADHVAVALSNAVWEERLYHQAHYDALTNLPNRALLKDRLEQAIARAQRNESCVGVVFLDLDHFKVVNDSLGHTCGDMLLQKTAKLLTDTVRSVDTVVRFGGDEFVIIIPDIPCIENVAVELESVAEKILAATRGDFTLNDQKVHMQSSIGIALYPSDGSTPDELVKNADTAMYHAKEQGRGRYKFFAPQLNAAASRRLTLERELRNALHNDELQLNYQPKVDTITGKLQGVEALLRWYHPERGIVPPVEFIHLAEETGLILKIGEWALKTACHQAKAWLDAGYPAMRMAVNVSPRQFAEEDFLPQVTGILKASGLDPRLLELEVTESMVMADHSHAIDKLKRLNAMGIYLSIDDFGTGYSSLRYLRMLPIHALKIDRSFILGMTEDENTQAIVSSTIFLAHQLGFDVVAEGVETEGQRALLKGWCCNELQGYLISRPVPADELERLLEAELKDPAAQDGRHSGAS